MRVRFVTLGCPKNEVDSASMRSAVAGSLHELTDDPDSADAVVLNTCAFIQEAVEEAIEHTLELAEWRADRPGRRLVVAGCLPSRYAGELETELPEVDAFVPVAEEGTLVAVLDRLAAGVPAADGARPRPVGASETRPYAYLKVSDGCSRRCAYCTIPDIRGPYRSRPPADILADARRLAADGARELVLVGQDVSAYGRDLGNGASLPALLRSLGEVDGARWVRVMYVQPDGLTEELLDAMAGTPSVVPYLDVPLQHAAPEVLRRMGRRGSAEEFLALVDRVRGALPGAALRTTLIAGFPGETPAESRLLEEFVTEAAFDYVGVFAYSPEEGTPAASLPGQLRPAERRRRAQRLRDLADVIGVERAADRVGSVLDILVEGTDEDGQLVGRFYGQAPEIDGVVSLDGTLPAGSFVSARIVDSLGYDLGGEVT